MIRTPTREKIIAQAVRLICQRGYGETTVGDIESAAGLSPRAGGFYRHFKSKEDALIAALAKLEAEIGAELRVVDVVSLQSIRAELLVIARALIRHAAIHRPLRVLFQREGHKLPALRRAARGANARLAAMDVVPWVESALVRSGRGTDTARELALIVFGPVLAYFQGIDRGDPHFAVGDADDFLTLWADHWAAWFEPRAVSATAENRNPPARQSSALRPAAKKGKR
jgi:AcrR family transcriptional regulator